METDSGGVAPVYDGLAFQAMIPVSTPALAEARQLLTREGITNARVLEAGAEDLTAHFGTEAFDMVLSVDVYEHLHREDGLEHLREVSSVLKPGGSYDDSDA